MGVMEIMESYKKLVNDVYTLEKAEEYYKYLKEECNYTEEQIDAIIEECLSTRNYMRKNKDKEPRNITTSTYERCMKKTEKEVSCFLTSNK